MWNMFHTLIHTHGHTHTHTHTCVRVHAHAHTHSGYSGTEDTQQGEEQTSQLSGNEDTAPQPTTHDSRYMLHHSTSHHTVQSEVKSVVKFRMFLDSRK